jgi:hypothetical protein
MRISVFGFKVPFANMVPNQQSYPRPITGTSFTELSPTRRGFFLKITVTATARSDAEEILKAVARLQRLILCDVLLLCEVFEQRVGSTSEHVVSTDCPVCSRHRVGQACGDRSQDPRAQGRRHVKPFSSGDTLPPSKGSAASNSRAT